MRRVEYYTHVNGLKKFKTDNHNVWVENVICQIPTLQKASSYDECYVCTCHEDLVGKAFFVNKFDFTGVKSGMGDFVGD